jgi:hypothetical protein
MQKQTTVNRFTRGLISDNSLPNIPADAHLDSMNIKLMRQSDGYYAGSVQGNEERFLLTAGFQPLAASAYLGVLYILSHNPVTNVGEIGTYPAPRFYTDGYDDEYRPLRAFTFDNPSIYDVSGCEPLINQVPLSDFRTPSLNFDLAFPARLILREDFDGSVNLYWTDFSNPIRSINSGFVQATGRSNGRVTSELQVQNGAINLLNESEYHPVVRLNQLQTGGNLKAGHYFFFVRYVDANYNATSFLGVSAPVPIFNELSALGTIVVKGGDSQQFTNKQAILDISNLDPVSAFVEVGFLYYYGQDEYEAKLIDKRFPISGMTNVQIIVSGNESINTVTIEDLIAYKPSDALKARDICQLNNVFYMANTQGVEIDHPDLRKLCCAIELQEDRTLQKPIASSLPGTNPFGRNPLDVHEQVGYFSGETYIFAVVPVFKGGFVGRALPIQGFDNFRDLYENGNGAGIFRFSDQETVPVFSGGSALIKGIRFVTSAAQTIYQNSTWLQEHLIGFYLVRGDRRPNLLYQGLSCRCVDGKIQNLYEAQYAQRGGQKGRNPVEGKYLPLWEEAVPHISITNPVATGNYRFEARYRQWTGSYDYPARLGVFSLDYMLDKRDVGDQVHVRRLFQTVSGNWTPKTRATSDVPFPLYYSNQNIAGWDLTSINPPSVDRINVEAVNVRGFNAIPEKRFVSKLDEGAATGQDGLFYLEDTNNDEYLLNLPIALPDYIGLVNTPFDPSWHRAIVNVCLSDPETLDYKATYDFKNTLFSPISGFLATDTFFAQDHTAYQGDCFVARSYIKTFHAHEAEIGDQLIDLLADVSYDYLDVGGGPYYRPSGTVAPSDYFPNGWGLLISVVMEHRYNPNYRIEKGRNYFYPATGSVNIGKDFVWIMDSPESNLYNTGYKRMLAPRGYLGLDILEPITNNRFPTRIRPSIRHVFGGVKDGYRIFVPAEQKDFDYAYGPIQAVVAYLDWIYSVQDNAINQHPINERAGTTTDQGDTLVFAQNEKLTEYKRTLTNLMGSQHTFSVIVTGGGVHGFDYARKIWWRVAGNEVQDLTLVKQCMTWIEQTAGELSLNGTILHSLPNSHTAGLGIHAAYDVQEKEVLMTFLLSNEKKHTLCFAEKLDTFQTRYSFTPTLYTSIRDDFFSFSERAFWQHGRNTKHNTFYGQTDESWIRFVAHAGAQVVKHWDNMNVHMNNRWLAYARFSTQHQRTAIEPFNTPKKWLRPFYRVNQWNFPIPRAEATQEALLSRFNKDSPMLGQYLVIELGYADDKPMNIQEVFTSYHEHQKF